MGMRNICTQKLRINIIILNLLDIPLVVQLQTCYRTKQDGLHTRLHQLVVNISLVPILTILHMMIPILSLMGEKQMHSFISASY